MRYLPISKIVVHHSCGGSWESIIAQHRAKGWGDLSAYHWFVEGSGAVREGRAEKDFSPATRSWAANHSGIHICVSGNFEIEQPTEWQLNALARMIKHKMETYKIKPENVVGHRDCSATACPGKNLYFKLHDMTFLIPEWAKLACEKARRKKIITKDFHENITAYRLCAILDNLGMLDDEK